MAAETGFLIDGTIYEVPTLLSLDMAERRVMFEDSGYIQEDFLWEQDEDDDAYEERVGKLMRHPGVMEALMHIAYQRGNPTVKRETVRMIVEKTPYLEAISTMEAAVEPEEDAVPLELTTPLDEPSLSEPSSSKPLSEPTTDSGGTASMNDSDQPAVTPIPIGTTRSATSSPESAQTESVA